MKIKHLIFTTLVGASLALGFSSCSNDDEDIIKNPTESQVTNLSFEDTNLEAGRVAGVFIWKKPVGYSNLSKIMFYSSSDGIKKENKLGEVSPETESFTIEAQNYFKYVVVVSVYKDGSEEENITKIEIDDLFHGGIYILNSGKQGSNNANLAFYSFETADPTKKLTENIFENVNKKAIGDTGQDMIVYGSKMYIAVYGSGVIYVTDKSGKILKTIESTKDGVKQKPRSLTSYEGKVYATFFDGYLAKIDTTEMNIQNKIQVGRNPEYVRAANGKIFVANSGGMDYNTPLGYDKTVSVVDASTFTEAEKIEVVINPDKMAVDSEGDIYVISNGNYGDVPNTLQRIHKEGNEYVVTKIGNATWMSMSNDKLYIIYSQYDANWNQTISYRVYDAKTEKMITDNFITDGTEVKEPYSITTDPVTNYIYIGTSDYTNNGDMYIFTWAGKLVKKFDTKGINPMGAYFVTK